MKNKVLYTLAAALAASFAATTVHAQPSDEVIYTPTSYDVFLPENGPPGSEYLPAFAPAPVNLPNQAVLLYDGVPGQSELSDALWVQSGYFYFESDYNEQPLTYYPASGVTAVVASIQETGELQDVGVLLSPALPSGTLLVMSDVPEPSTLALIGMGGTALAALIRRRKA
jgi:hypothetical protein